MIGARVPVTRGALLRCREANPSRSALSEVGKGAGRLVQGDGRALAAVGDSRLFQNAEAMRDGIGVDISTKEKELPTLGLAALDQVAQFFNCVFSRGVFVPIRLEHYDDFGLSRRWATISSVALTVAMHASINGV